ncbi:MAG: histidinol-phosphate transaminase [Lachnospiraceae bacterium]|nr:histidinol-phosphate transaminase [Lachnospiraceae bacterium]
MGTWESNIRRVTPYTPGEQPNKPGMIKLNTNENPYPPAPGVERALRETDVNRLRLYPDPTASELVKAIAQNKGLSGDQVFVGVGSDDVLAMCFLTFFNSGKPILFPDITYSFYDVWADVFRIPFETPALDADFNLVPGDYYRENGGIIFPNPNAPTGVECPQDVIEDILRHNPEVIVIVDEAYVDFGAVSALPLLEKYENLIVVQTFSKSRSLAGLRIGYAMANPELIRCLNDVKYSFNSYTMDQTALELGAASIRDTSYFNETIRKIAATRERTKKRLRELGFSFRDSKSNFIFATHENCPAKELFDALRERDIYVRYFPKPRIDQYLRITIGTDEEMDVFLSFLENYLNNRCHCSQRIDI